MSELESLLRTSLETLRAKPLHGVEDLQAIVVELSAAIRNVTKDRIRLVLDPLKAKHEDGPTFAVVLQLPVGETVLRVVALSQSGYPATLWNTFAGWDSGRGVNPTRAGNASELRSALRSLISNPDSDVIRLIANELAVMQAESGELAGSGAN